jgi:cyclohexanone monooxygenase
MVATLTLSERGRRSRRSRPDPWVPNRFFMGGIQSGEPNFTELYRQSLHLGYVIGRAVRDEVRTIEPHKAAEAGWLRTLQESVQNRGSFKRECTPGYYNNEGRPGEGPGWFGGNYGGNTQAFFTILREWRARDDFEGLERT